MTEVYILSNEQLAQYREHVDACFDAEPKLWDRRFKNKEEIWQLLASNHAQMWAVCDPDCIHCVFMTEIATHPKRILRIFWAYGEGLLEVFPSVDMVVDRFAAGLHCDEIEIVGRKGWEKIIRASGGEYVGSLYRRPTKLLKGH